METCVGFLIVTVMGASLSFSDRGQESLCPVVRGDILTWRGSTHPGLGSVPVEKMTTADKQVEKTPTVTLGVVVAVKFMSGRLPPSFLLHISTDDRADWWDK